MIEKIDKPLLMVIDDEKEVGEFIKDIAESIGYDCYATTSVNDFLESVKPGIHCIIIDLMMPELDGIELLRKLSAQKCVTKIILISGFDKKVLKTAENLAKSLGLETVGILEKPFNLDDLQTLLAKAKNQLPVTKYQNTGRQFVQLTEDEIKESLKEGYIFMNYQPQIKLPSRQVTGIEALVRIRHPVKGLIPPDMFIPGTEKYGLINELTFQVIENTIRDYKKLSPDHVISISINISSKSLTDLSIPDRLVRLANQYDVSLDHFILEITESGLIKEYQKALDILVRLRMKNMHLSIDDFGTGYSSMSQIRKIPASELKIDKSFINDLLTDEGARSLIIKTIEIGHILDMIVVAEGVETKEQELELEKLGCDIIQGYLYSKPLDITCLIEWINNYNR